MPVFLLIPIIALLFSGFLTIRKGREVVRRHGAHNLIGRAIVLRPHHGKCKTNATFFRDSTDRTSGKSSGRHDRAGWKNGAVSLSALGMFLMFVYGLFAARLLTLICSSVAFVTLAGLLITLSVRKARRWHTNKSLITPLSVAAGAILDPDRSLGAHPENLITLEPDWLTRKRGRLGAIMLPDAFAANPGQQEALQHLVTSRLPVPVKFRWQTSHTSKMSRQLIIMAAEPLPTLVPFASKRAVMAACPADQVLLGPAHSGEDRFWDMSSEDPHAVVEANTRRGKTRLLLLIVCQVLRQLAELVVVIDPKRVGVDEALAGIPGVEVHSDPGNVDAMWSAIHRFRVFMDERIAAFEKDRTLEFKRALLVIDEMSQFAEMSRILWEETRDPKTTKASRPPWLDDLAAICFQGAQFKCSVLIFGQRIYSGSVGGLLSSFGTRLLAGFTKQAYMRLVGVTPVPVSQSVRGRFLYWAGDQPEWIQTVLGSDEELRAYALETRPRAPLGGSVNAESVAEPATDASDALEGRVLR